MLSQLQSLWKDHLGRLKVAKHRIKLLQPDTAPVHFASYRAGPTKKFEKAEVKKSLQETSSNSRNRVSATHRGLVEGE